MSEQQASYRVFRPEALAAFVREQPQPVYVNCREVETLRAAGAANVETLPYGGPQRGEVWIEVPHER